MYLNLKVDKKKHTKYGTPFYTLPLYFKTPIFSPFSKSKKKVTIVKGAMSTNGYENVSPGARFLKAAASQPFMSVTGVPIFSSLLEALTRNAHV